MVNRFDVAIVGGGPSGALAATLLASRGARVALIDGSHPREKICGGGLTGRALALVQDQIDLRGLRAVRIRSARFVDAATNAAATVPLDERTPPPLVVSGRMEFDGLLWHAAERAGAAIVGERAVDVARAPWGFAVRTAGGTTLDASWIVGADGANSLVRRRMAAPFSRADISIATGFFAHGVTSSEVVIQLTDDPPGYIWSFPRPDHLAIGICAQADSPVTAGTLRARVAQWIQATRIADGARLVPYSWPIPSLSARALGVLPLSGDRWITIGDAAGLVDPITREGIYFALQSAIFAADALTHTGRDAALRYAARARAEIVDELIRAARFKAGFFRPRFTRLLIKALQHSPRIQRVMADLVAGEQPYRTLKWRLVRTLELRLAWRVFTATDNRLVPEREHRAG